MASTHASPLFEAYKNSSILWRNAPSGVASVQLSPETMAVGTLTFLSPCSFRHFIVCNSFNSTMPKKVIKKENQEIHFSGYWESTSCDGYSCICHTSIRALLITFLKMNYHLWHAALQQTSGKGNRLNLLHARQPKMPLGCLCKSSASLISQPFCVTYKISMTQYSYDGNNKNSGLVSR